jgi:hypothetical protein
VGSRVLSGLSPEASAVLVKAPAELEGFRFLMAWDPRLDSDARYVSLREAVKTAIGSD